MEKKKKSAAAVLLIALVGCGAMAVVDAAIQPVYAVKSAVKAVFFLAIPLLYSCFNNEISFKKLIIPSKKGFFKSLALGLAIYAVILGAYFTASSFFDFSPIADILTENVGVKKENFLWVALYISFFNSLLEEFFFRGFAFISLTELTSKKFAFVFSAVIFSVYHVAIMTGWFSPVLFILAMAGLTAGGLIFNLLDMKNENIYNSWMAHMFANFAINTVGFILFGIM